MKLTLLGTGNPEPSLLKCQSGYLIQHQDSAIVVDMGPGTFRRLLEAGVRPADVTHVIFSHLHFDHTADFATLFHSRWLQSGGLRPGFDIFGPIGTKHFVDALFGPKGAYREDLVSRTKNPLHQRVFEAHGGVGELPWPDTKVTEIEAGEEVRLGSVSVRVETVPHFQPYLPNLGIRISNGQQTISYTSDVHIPPSYGLDHTSFEGLIRICTDADLMLAYSSGLKGVSCIDMREPVPALGLSPALLGKIAQKCNVPKLVTVHHGTVLDQDDERSSVQAAIREHFHGQLVWGQDLMVFDA